MTRILLQEEARRLSRCCAGYLDVFLQGLLVVHLVERHRMRTELEVSDGRENPAQDFLPHRYRTPEVGEIAPPLAWRRVRSSSNGTCIFVTLIGPVP